MVLRSFVRAGAGAFQERSDESIDLSRILFIDRCGLVQKHRENRGSLTPKEIGHPEAEPGVFTKDPAHFTRMLVVQVDVLSGGGVSKHHFVAEAIKSVQNEAALQNIGDCNCGGAWA
jgi:hypothetical protein